VQKTNLQHRKIVDALIARDEDQAERAAREHVEKTMAIVEPAIQI
jgi:DNA-binding GntR family transcriptional regulator